MIGYLLKSYVGCLGGYCVERTRAIAMNFSLFNFIVSMVLTLTAAISGYK